MLAVAQARERVRPVSTDTGFDLKHNSRQVTEGPSRAAARAYLKGIGYTDDDLAKPIIGVASTWIETMPCNFHLRALAAAVKEGVREAGGTPMELNTIAISDGITMGTSGMKTSLVSREVVADSIELVARGQLFDGVIALSGCDKTIPGTVMALARLDVPGVMLYGGSISPGRFHGHDVSIQDVFEAVGAHAAGKISDEELEELVDVASPGAGACGGQYTANTMAMAFEVMGICPPVASYIPAQNGAKREAAKDAGRLAVDVLRRGLRPSAIITRESLENAIAAVATSGGSTNAVLHLLAVATEAGVDLSIDDFDRIASKTPQLCSLKPSGEYLAVDLYAAGGIMLVAQRLAELGLLHEDALTVTGRTIGEHAAEAEEAPGSRSSTPSTTRSAPPAAWPSCAATSPPRAAWSSSPATTPAAISPAPRASSSPRRTRWPPSWPSRSTRATSSSSATRAPPAAPACARCSRSPPRSWARASARRWRCSPTAASRAPPTASWPATSPRRRRAAAPSPPSVRATP